MFAKQQKIVGIICGFGLLATVGFADYFTGYKVSLLVFYLLPILFAVRYVNLGFGFLMAVLSAGVWLTADLAAGDQYPDVFTPIWNTGIRLSIFLLIVILFSNRKHLQALVDQRTESLRQEIKIRSRLEKELLGIAESEQRRIGRDLHDSLGQHLTATALAGKILTKKLASNVAVEPARSEQVVKMIEQAIDLTRNLTRTLHPLELDAEGLENAMKHLADNVAQAFDVTCRFQQSGAVVLDDPAMSIHLYRIAQEAATNAVRHGQAKHIVISLDAANKSLMLAISDDGSGLPPAALTKSGMGLKLMRYRAEMIGGTLDLQNLPAGGLRVVCIVNPDRKDG